MSDKKQEITSEKTSNKMSEKTTKGSGSNNKVSNLPRNLFFGSLITTAVGVLLVLYSGNKGTGVSHIEVNTVRQVVDHEIMERGTFGEEIAVDELSNGDNVVLEEVENTDESDDELLAPYEHEEIKDEFLEDESDSEDGQNINEETMDELLRDDVKYELDEGFLQKDEGTAESETIVVEDDPESAEYEHEAEDLVDNNWSDDEAELKRMENDVIHQ